MQFIYNISLLFLSTWWNGASNNNNSNTGGHKSCLFSFLDGFCCSCYSTSIIHTNTLTWIQITISESSSLRQTISKNSNNNNKYRRSNNSNNYNNITRLSATDDSLPHMYVYVSVESVCDTPGCKRIAIKTHTQKKDVLQSTPCDPKDPTNQHNNNIRILLLMWKDLVTKR